MADDLIIGSNATTPLDLTIAADEVAGKKIQRVKIQHGIDGVAVDASATDPFPVTVTTGGGGAEFAEDAAHASGALGKLFLAVRTDTAVARAGTDADYIPLITDNTGRLWVNGSGVTQPVSMSISTSGGYAMQRLLSAATTNATSVKASPGQVYGWYLFNANAATRYLKLYNKASAPTVGTDTPVLTIPIPAGAAANVEISGGLEFTTGIAFALTTGIADADTGAVAANDIVVNLFWK